MSRDDADDRDAAELGAAKGDEGASPVDGSPRDADSLRGEAGYLVASLRRSLDEESLRDQIREASAAALRKVETSAPPSVAARIQAFRERIRSRRTLDTAWRMMVLTLGLTLVVAGLVMFLIPGPGFATVILGLVVLGSEFTWATRALNPMKDAARRASEAALDPRRRRRNIILGAIGGVIAGLVALWYLWWFGLTLDPLVGLAQAIFDWMRGLFQ